MMTFCKKDLFDQSALDIESKKTKQITVFFGDLQNLNPFFVNCQSNQLKLLSRLLKKS